MHRDYSYGDSAGFTPNFPFNHLTEAAEPITAQMYLLSFYPNLNVMNDILITSLCNS